MILLVSPDSRGGAKYALMPEMPRPERISREWDARRYIGHAVLPEGWNGTLDEAIAGWKAKGGDAAVKAYYDNLDKPPPKPKAKGPPAPPKPPGAP